MSKALTITSEESRKKIRFTEEQIKELHQLFSWYDTDKTNCVLLKELPAVIQMTIGMKWTQDYILQLIQDYEPSILDKFTESLSKNIQKKAIEKKEHSNKEKPSSDVVATSVSTTNDNNNNNGGSGGNNDGDGGGDGQEAIKKDSTFATLPVPFDTYVKILNSKLISEEDEEFLWKETFKKFDVNDSEVISPAELRIFFKTVLGENISPVDAIKMIEELDLDKDGVINFEEFKILAKQMRK